MVEDVGDLGRDHLQLNAATQIYGGVTPRNKTRQEGEGTSVTWAPHRGGREIDTWHDKGGEWSELQVQGERQIGGEARASGERVV
jgi:hypothetical protein